ncbi:basic leucine zipper 61 [Ricinus communis]|uniref:Transcription factor RF2a, putative n=1 Tax=Ricinus communis TaxID=3988 RepID=B9SGM7_RICCO|nr:basic leucine zipper 61 [Ricinus communis]EEF37273.1 Transcription factor RF2a, putative [Ricinus communis]|eukprot:XP_002525146.1 basic leucine zipper 61 [Ricinus communis]
MAQLPPKIPNMQPTWPEFSHHQKLPSMGIIAPSNNNAAASTAAAAATTTQNPSWVDEFLDFSSARRGTHRRSVSDSIAFLEAPLIEECRAIGAPHHHHHHHHGSGHNSSSDFDKFDDEQFMSMFNDDISNAVAPSCSNPSTPSDHNSFNDEKEPTLSDQKQQKIRNESDEVQSQCQTDTQNPSNATNTTSSDRIIDPKRVKRILANRQSAQRSRVRKLQYISELERSVTSLQAEVSVLSPRVAFLDHQRLLLNVDNSALKQRIAALAQDKIFKDAHQEALKREIERLRQVYHQQNLKNMENATASPSPATDSTAPTEKGQQLLQV